MPKESAIHRYENSILLPGLATAHSHAFQRALRGRTQRRATGAGSFWSWRGLMYALAEQIDPETLYRIARFAYIELALSGVTAVGEFHYLHHDEGGAPYAERTLLSTTMIQAAKEVGLRICLIRTAYLRGGHRQELAPAQRRFADPDVETVLRDVDDLRRAFADDPTVRIGVAAHSVRAVPRPAIAALADYARQHGLPFHMHVAEQRREIEECVAEHGLRPVDLLHETGALHERFVAIHATHLSEREIDRLGQAQAFVCLCRTTERDLGDGLPRTADLMAAGARICVGVDSHASGDAFEEIRAVEWDERSRAEARHVAASGPELLRAGTVNGYAAIGFDEAWREDGVTLRGTDPSVAGLPDDLLADGVIFGATPRAVDEVHIAGRPIVRDGRHPRYEEALYGYLEALRRLDLL